MKNAASGIHVRPMAPTDLSAAACLLRAIEAEAKPGDPDAPERGQTGLRQSLAHDDITRSDCAWVFLAELERKLVGYALAVRIPKLDHRLGFVFVDELYVLKAYRRRGVATKLLEVVHELSKREGYPGVRLLVRPSNAPARLLYKRLNYVEHHAILCELQVTTNPRRETAQPHD
jgi:ribosomal protein S18 acetylase RimI-like enzyme